MERKIIEVFESVQAIPYRCRHKISSDDDLGVRYANCRQKRYLLKRELTEYGFCARDLDAIFDWRDLPIPEEILKILKKSGTLQKHHLLEIRINDTYFKVDPVWDLELEIFGFPVTREWKGDSDSKQVTNGNILFYDPASKKISLPYYPDERITFADEFNKWIGRQL